MSSARLPVARISTFALATVITLAHLLLASPAHAQWTRVLQLPVTDMYSVWVKGDTITTGADSIAYVSVDGGASWLTSAKVAPGATSVQAVRMHKGRLYAGTFGQGVFVSDNLGATWQAFNQGLTGGIFDTHLFVVDMLVHGDTLIVATSGAGPYRRTLAPGGTWSHYGAVFEPNQSSNMNDVAVGGSRLLACAGANGTVYFRDPGATDWTLSWLANTGGIPGLGAHAAIWSGTGWIVGSNIGVFHSAAGQEPWSHVDLGLGTILHVAFTHGVGEILGAFGPGSGTVYARTLDHGATWDPVETQDFVFTYDIARHGAVLYAARFDGLWRRPLDAVSAPPPAPTGLRIAIAGAQPVRDAVRFRIDLPTATHASIDVFDVRGRRVARLEGTWDAGTRHVPWDARALTPGVYHARLEAGGAVDAVRFVRGR